MYIRQVEFCDTVFECVDKGFKKNEPIDVIIRPEDLKILDKDDPKSLISATVISSVFKGDHYQVTLIAGGNELVAHDTESYDIDDVVGLYIKPFDLHIMHKTRIINEIDTYITGENLVEICGADFECKTDLPEGTPVKVQVDFDDVEITDDEEDGTISATVLSSIYKGSYYQAILSTDDHYNFFADTDYEWLKGDRVGIKIAPDKILIEVREETEKVTEESAAPAVEDETLREYDRAAEELISEEEVAELEANDNIASVLTPATEESTNENAAAQINQAEDEE
ncbi:MAG: TOBE domain-containing protein [Clostridia bacterium]|nr:TOBE domain-containing protein [Clostridia bacterium]